MAISALVGHAKALDIQAQAEPFASCDSPLADGRVLVDPEDPALATPPITSVPTLVRVFLTVRAWKPSFW